MEAVLIEQKSHDPMEPKWHNMIAVSILLHLALFSIMLFVPEQINTRRIRTGVYEVHLVEMPARSSRPGIEGRTRTGKVINSRRFKKAAPAKRISSVKKKERPTVIAKRTIRVKSKKTKRPKESPSTLIDRAVSKIQKKVRAEKKDPVDQAVSRLERRLSSSAGARSEAGRSDTGITGRIYEMEVVDRIKSNWSYPVDLISPKERKNFEAIVVIEVERDGTVLKSWFKSRSSDVRFNQSVMKAIERSGTLPPFPEGYRKTHDEIEINFNLSDLENY